MGGVKASDALSAILKMDAVLSLDVIKNGFDVLEKQQKINSVPAADDHAGDPEAEEINALVAERTAGKKNKDFARADEIRNQLAARGITIVDGPSGAVWHRVRS